jgi:hypothetical protein
VEDYENFIRAESRRGKNGGSRRPDKSGSSFHFDRRRSDVAYPRFTSLLICDS